MDSGAMEEGGGGVEQKGEDVAERGGDGGGMMMLVACNNLSVPLPFRIFTWSMASEMASRAAPLLRYFCSSQCVAEGAMLYDDWMVLTGGDLSSLLEVF